jgi:hypothetical protein
MVSITLIVFLVILLIVTLATRGGATESFEELPPRFLKTSSNKKETQNILSCGDN